MSQSWPEMIHNYKTTPGPIVRPGLGRSETPVGVEPTSTGLQPVAWPSGSSVGKSPAQVDGRQSSFLSKSSDLGLHHQKRPFFRQHFLKRLPLPQGQRSLRPSFSSRSLSPCTMRTPRPTCVSDGKPFRRLLIVSKKTAVRHNCVWTWDTSIRVLDQKQTESVLARNRTWSSTFAESRAIRHTPRTCCYQYLARESNPVLRFRRPPCFRHTRKACFFLCGTAAT